MLNRFLWRVALPIALLAVIVLGAGISSIAVRSVDDAAQLLLQQGLNINQGIAQRTINIGLVDEKIAALENILETGLEGAESVQLYTPDGRLLVDALHSASGVKIIRGRPANALPNQRNPQALLQQTDRSRLWQLVTARFDQAVVWYPIIESDQRLAGWIRTRVDESTVDAILASERASAIRSFLLGATILLLGAYLLLQRPLAAFGQAVRFAEHLDASGESATAGNSGVLEINNLFSALNAASHELRHRAEALQQHELFLETLTDNLNEMIFATDENGRTVFVSKSIEELTGWTVSELMDRDVWQVLTGAEADSARADQAPHRIVIRTGSNWSSGDQIIYDRDRKYAIPVEVSAAPLTRIDAHMHGALVVITDNSAREQATRQLMDAREQAEAANVAKTRFLSVIGHELRTPLNAIIGMTHQASSNQPNAQIRRCLQVISDASSLLRGLIENIIEYSTLGAGNASTLSNFLLTEFLDRTIHDIADRASRKDITVSREIDPTVPRHLIGDTYSLGRILEIYCDNAVKFTEHGIITLRARGHKNANSVSMRFEVEDTGIGISPETQKLLFSEFSPADMNNSRRQSGLGLGLALVHQLAERLGGSVGVESTPGFGSVFWLEVELAIAETDSAVERQKIAISDSVDTAEAPIYEASSTVNHELDRVIAEIRTMIENSEFMASRQIEAYEDMLAAISPSDLDRMRGALRVFDFDEAQHALEDLQRKSREAQKALYSEALQLALKKDSPDGSPGS